jgi:hypothetical protein
MAQRGLIDSVTLILLINRIQMFDNEVASLVGLKSSLQTKTEKI